MDFTKWMDPNYNGQGDPSPRVTTIEENTKNLPPEDKPMPGVLDKLGIWSLGQKAGIIPRNDNHESIWPSKLAAMLMPNIQGRLGTSPLRNDPNLAVQTLGVAGEWAQALADPIIGEDPIGTMNKAAKGDPMAIGETALTALPLGGAKLLKPIAKGVGTGFSAGKSALLKGTGAISDTQVGQALSRMQEGWGRGVDKFTNYLITPDAAVLPTIEKKLGVTLPDGLKKQLGNVATFGQKGGQKIAEIMQPAIERIEGPAQGIIRKGKAQAQLLTAEAEKVGAGLARLPLQDREDFLKIARGYDIPGASPEVKQLIQESTLRKQDLGIDPRMMKDFDKKMSSLYTKVLESPQDVLNSPTTRAAIEAIEGSVPNDKWFRQVRTRSAIKAAIENPATSPEDAILFKELWQMPATTPEMSIQAARSVRDSYIKRNLLQLTGNDAVISPVMKPGYVETAWGGLGTRKAPLYMDRDVALELESYSKIDAMSQGAFSKYFTSPWKTMKVIMSPASQVRNVFSNFMLNDIGGLPVYRLDIYAQAVRGMAKNQDTWKDFSRITGGGGTFSRNELSGLEATWKFKDKWYDVPYKILDKASVYPKAAYNANEQVFKYSKYLHNLEKGMGKVEAATDAVIPTFNYSEITPAVAWARTHYIPFATWTTKVIPYTFEMAAKHPLRVGKWFAFYEGMQHYAQEQAGMNDDEWKAYKQKLPEYMKNGVYMLLPWRDSRHRLNMLDMTYAVPGLGDIQQMRQQGLWGTVIQHPLLTVPADLVRNKTFSGAPITYDWQPAGVQAQKSAQHIWESIFPSWFGPYGSDYKRYVKALSEQPGAQTVGQAIATQFGGRVQPLDDQQIYRLHDTMIHIGQQEMTQEMNKELRMTKDPEKMREVVTRYQDLKNRFLQDKLRPGGYKE